MPRDSIDSKPVRVSIPASVAADIGQLKKATATILDKLGCQACCSGHDILFELQRDFVISDKLSAHPVPSQLGRLRANPNLATRGERTVRVGLKPAEMDKIDNVFLALDRIAELTGHPACATGCDMLLQLERILVMNERLEIKEQVMTLG